MCACVYLCSRNSLIFIYRSDVFACRFRCWQHFLPRCFAEFSGIVAANIENHLSIFRKKQPPKTIKIKKCTIFSGIRVLNFCACKKVPFFSLILTLQSFCDTNSVDKKSGITIMCRCDYSQWLIDHKLCVQTGCSDANQEIFLILKQNTRRKYYWITWNEFISRSTCLKLVQNKIEMGRITFISISIDL